MAGGGGQITAFNTFTAFPPSVEKTVTGWSGVMTSGAQFRILGIISEFAATDARQKEGGRFVGLRTSIKRRRKASVPERVAVLSVNGCHKRKCKCRGAAGVCFLSAGTLS